MNSKSLKKSGGLTVAGKGDNAVAFDQDDNVVAFEVTESVRSFAVELGVDLAASVSDRADIAAEHMSRSQRHMLAAGLLLMSVKAECERGEFLNVISERGFEVRAAQRAMLYANYVASRPEGERQKLIQTPKSKVLAIAGADEEVLEALASKGLNIDALSVRALHEQIRELKAALADKTVQAETAEAEATAAKKAASRIKDRAGEVPIVIADVRAEVVAQAQAARIAVDEILSLGRDLMNLVGQDVVHDWVDPTARLAIAGLVSLQVAIDGALKQYVKGFSVEGVEPVPMSYLGPVEVEHVALKFADLIALNDHQTALRDWERKQARPKGKGRPETKPEAPKTLGARHE
jgi:hypothetical protein